MSRFTRVVVAAILSSATISLTVTPAHAAPPGVYVVKEGDSLGRIAQKLGVKLPDLLNANGMTVDSLILPGQQLVVPQTDSNASSGGTYTVKAGDSLSVIAARVKVSLGALLAANGITASSLITPGMTLTLPAGAVAPVAQSSTSSSTSSGTASAGTYTVKAGDSLSMIASRSKVSLTALLAVNNMTVNSLITPGMKLTLPAGAMASAGGSTGSGSSPAGNGSTGAAGGYTVKAGDSLGGIASRNGVTLAALLAANSMTATSLILPGMTLALPAGTTPADTQSNDQTSSDARIQTVLQFALAQQGKPYQFAAAGPDAYDCSGLTKRAYAQIGITLVHQSASQATQGTAVAFWSEPIQPGDLVFMATKGNDVITHVGIAIDGDTWIQARRPGDTVRVGPMPAKTSIVAVRRFVP
jgi:LysM repeat protein